MEKVYKHWAITGGFVSVLILIYQFLFSPDEFFSIKSAGWMNLAFLMMHQFEEYVYPGGFRDFFNNYLYREKGFMRFRLNDAGAFHVNVTLGWTVYLICALFNGCNSVFLFAILGITLINGIVHAAAAIALRMYNPGLITGLFIFIPFPVYTVIQNYNSVSTESGSWPVIIICAIAGSLTIPLTLFLFREKQNT